MKVFPYERCGITVSLPDSMSCEAELEKNTKERIEISQTFSSLNPTTADDHQFQSKDFHLGEKGGIFEVQTPVKIFP